MKPEQIYNSLKDLAEKLNIAVSEENFKKSGVRTKSGYCIVKGEQRFIIDKHLKIREKVGALSSFLGNQPHEDLYVVPAIRRILRQSAAQNQERESTPSIESTDQIKEK